MSPGVPHRSRRGPRRNSVVGLVRSAVVMTWRADRGRFLWAAGFQIVGALAPTALVLIGQYLLNAIARTGTHRPSLGAVLPPIILLAVVSSIVAATATLQQQQQRMLSERVSSDTWDRVLDVTTGVPYEVYESADFYDQLQRIKNNAISQPIAVTTSLFGILGSGVGTLSLLVVVLTIAPLLVPVMLFAGLPSLLLARRVSTIEFAFLTRAMPLFRARQYFRDLLSGRDEAKEVRVFGAARALRLRHQHRRAAFETELARHTRRRIALGLSSVALSSVFLGLTLGLAIWMLISGRIPIGAAAAAILAIRFLATGLDQLFRSIGSLFEASTYLRDLDEFTQRGTLAQSAPTSVDPLRSGIQVRGLDFRYPAAAEFALTGVDLRIGKGELVALVGENGSGKTTLAKLIAGLYSPTSGTIRWDDTDYAAADLSAIRRQIAVIFQDFVRYQLSALDNIGLGEPDQAEDEAAARDAAQRANALELVERLPRGWHTVLSREFEDGTDLSGGQWQRVALARALRKPASLIILDEPSAALDPRAEAALFADIRAMLHGRSGLLISHRFSSVRLADRIYVLRAGRVVESGTHHELIEAGGLYAELYALQAQAYLRPT